MNLEQVYDELQCEIDKLSRAVKSGGSGGGSSTTATHTIGEFPENPKEGDVHYLLDANDNENASYRYNGEAWEQLTGFNYQLSDTAKIKVIDGYGLFQKLGASALADFYYYITELGYRVETGSGAFKKFFYCVNPIIVDPSVISGFTIKGKYRNAALEETVDWTSEITTPYCGLLVIGYGTDNDGNWLFWQLCRPNLLEANNNALHQGNIVAKQSGGSGQFIITSLQLNKVQPITRKRGSKK